MWGLNPYSEGATREGSKFATELLKPWDRIPAKFCYFTTQHISETLQLCEYRAYSHIAPIVTLSDFCAYRDTRYATNYYEAAFWLWLNFFA